MTRPPYIIFSDLDGTLLDNETYEFKDALAALQEVTTRNIPLILTSSKTAAEIRQLKIELDIEHPFIVENGAAIYVPEGYFRFEVVHQRKREGFLIFELGARYQRLRDALIQMRDQTGIKLVGFGDISVKDVQEVAGLNYRQAKSALNREYDEPFYVADGFDPARFRKLRELAETFGFSLTRGSRFYHLMGKTDKGRAVRHVRRLYQKQFGQETPAVGIGDTLNDLPLFEAVDIPILVRRPSNHYDEDILSQLQPQLADGIGPHGWNSAVLKLLKDS